MIKDRIGRHKLLSPINQNFNKICDIQGSFLKSTQKKFQLFLLAVIKIRSSANVMAPTALLNCPTKAEIRAVDSQSDLRILLQL